eukprot:scaffold3611_cov364-Prasinococcus_capsulatus_cf.AAC.3
MGTGCRRRHCSSVLTLELSSRPWRIESTDCRRSSALPQRRIRRMWLSTFRTGASFVREGWSTLIAPGVVCRHHRTATWPGLIPCGCN